MKHSLEPVIKRATSALAETFNKPPRILSRGILPTSRYGHGIIVHAATLWPHSLHTRCCRPLIEFAPRHWLHVGNSLLLVHASNEGWRCRGCLEPLDSGLVPLSASLARTRLAALHHRPEPLQHAEVLKPKDPLPLSLWPPVVRLILEELSLSPPKPAP